MNTVFIAILLMSATGGWLVLCLSLLHHLTEKVFSAAWHYHMHKLVVLFLLVPIGIGGSNLFVSLKNATYQALPNVPAILNAMITVPQTVRASSPQAGQILEQAAAGSVPADTIVAQTFTINVILSYLPLIWIAGTFLFIIWHGIQYVRFKKKITRTCFQVEDTAKLLVLHDAMVEMDIKGRPGLFSNEFIKTPMLFGLIKTYLILPEVDMSSRELKVILKHELIHYKRRDLWVKSAALAANAIHWFNPAAYKLKKSIDIYCELSCDEGVVSDMSVEERRFYGETILNVLCRVVNLHTGVYATLAESKKWMERRLTHIMNFKKNPKRIMIISVVAAVVLGISGCAAASVINMKGENIDNPSALSTDINSEPAIEIENANLLEGDGDTQYYWTVEGDNCVLYALDKNKSATKQLASFPPLKNEGSAPTLNAIVDFGICGNWIIVSVGHYEGSGGYFYGDFARMKKDGSELEHFWLTDDDTFVIVDEWIYYNFWTVKNSPADGDGCYRIRPDGTDNEYMGDILYSIFLYGQDGYVYGEQDTGKTIDHWNPMTDLIRCKPDGSGLTTLFSGESLPTFDNSDYMRYSDIEINKDYIAFTTSVHGYSDGDSWGGHYNYIADYRVNKDGSNLTLLREEYPMSPKNE